MTTPLIHIGYHKTGTTWLQAFVFDEAGHGYCSPWSRGDMIERLVLTKPLSYDVEDTRGWLAPGLASAVEKRLIPVLSAERFSGNPHSGGYDSVLVAERFAEALPGARVVAIVREQRAMIASCYKQYVRVGGACSARAYLNPPTLGRPRVPLFDPDFFCYDRLIARYRELFGAEHVLALPFESLKRDPDAFVARISAFAGAPDPGAVPREKKNVALSALACSLKRQCNRFLARDALNPAAPVGNPRVAGAVQRVFESGDRLTPGFARRWSERRLRRRVDEIARGRYAESNRALGAMIGEDLGALGYDV